MYKCIQVFNSVIIIIITIVIVIIVCINLVCKMVVKLENASEAPEEDVRSETADSICLCGAWL